MRFELKVPNDDEGQSLGMCEADALPRVGDSFLVYHPKVCRKEYEPFDGKVDAVVWETNPHLAKRGKFVAEPVVWLVERDGAVPIYCDCSEKERSEQIGEAPNAAALDRNARCFNCGDLRR